MRGRGYYGATPPGLWGRREFLRVGSLGALGLGLSDYLRLSAGQPTPARGDACIMIVLDGGPPQHETFDMKPDAPSDVAGTFRPIPTNVSGIRICEHLPRTAMQADKFAILRSVYGDTAIHFTGVYYLMTGFMPLQSVDFPSRGAVVAKELGSRNGLPPYVLNATLDHAAGPGFLGSAYSPFWVRSDPSSPDFRIDDLEIPLDMDWSEISDRRWLVKRLDAQFRERDTKGLFSDRERFFQEAESIIRSPAVKTAFDISAEPERLRNRYGRTPLGQGCLLARRLVEGGVRFVTINAARAIWDTHSDNFNRCEKVLLPEFDAAFATLMEDMHQRGLLESTLVVVAGEFGRTPKINPNAGRDHWPKVFSAVLAGAGVQGGQAYGSSDSVGGEPRDNPVSMEDLTATIYDRLGIDPDKEYHTPTNRPVRLANRGKPITSHLV
ncbi:MAG: DUF1501 domain-containing protein [Bryobacterales bacterium]|nr:DUF1501 domain-containing protein [Bryobacterales bacterium]